MRLPIHEPDRNGKLEAQSVMRGLEGVLHILSRRVGQYLGDFLPVYQEMKSDRGCRIQSVYGPPGQDILLEPVAMSKKRAVGTGGFHDLYLLPVTSEIVRGSLLSAMPQFCVDG
ncbi:hypothetical protein AA0535_0773 [Asaia krungthepensis NRIC 0535]|uniref:Uncharacterized protein n=1 Tax=Asaia krungthepensis NRIC 0535 TaxID=1307925 RepID=A0ABQ0PZI7_9PROT|nr:hypothetical protein AA0535_0773 [Asaia krungthepensis NRIC 0535]